jgi:hypothetical protein
MLLLTERRVFFDNTFENSTGVLPGAGACRCLCLARGAACAHFLNTDNSCLSSVKTENVSPVYRLKGGKYSALPTFRISRILPARQLALNFHRASPRTILRPQSFISAVERGQHRVSVVEFLEFAEAIGFDAPAAIRRIAAKPRE